MSNHSILVQNTLFGLSETAQLFYLEMLDLRQGHSSKSGELRAFFAACKYEESAGEVLDFILRNAPPLDSPSPVRSQLSKFFAVRWQHNFMDQEAA